MVTFIYIFCLLGTALSINNQCFRYKFMPRDAERSKDVMTNPNNVTCDSDVDGWYRFRTDEVATSCVPTDHCGTQAPIWMKDPIPPVGQTSYNAFCVNHDAHLGSGGTCCLFTFYQNVTNCGNHIVYQMNSDNLLCPSAYCTAPPKKCPLGSSSPSGYLPCHEAYPAMYSPPVLGGPVINKAGTDFSHTCTVNYNGSRADAVFEVTWRRNSYLFKTKTLANGSRTATIRSHIWKHHTGWKLTCSVVSYYSTSGPSGTRSASLTSNEYYGGLKVSPAPIVINESQSLNVSVQSTLPILCSSTPRDRCLMNLMMEITHGDPAGIVRQDGCTLQLHSKDWDSTRNIAEVQKEFAPLIDLPMKPKRVYALSFSLQNNNKDLDIWAGQRDFTSWVTTHDEPMHRCLVFGAIHTVGFLDTLPRSYNSSQAGDYVLYSSLPSDERTLKVHVRTWIPRAGTPLICGVALQYENTLTTVDMCSDRPQLVAPIVTQGDNNRDDIKVLECDGLYEIVTSDGVKLSARVHSLHLDAKLHIPPSYSIQGQGVCVSQSNTSALNDSLLDDSTSLFGTGGQAFFKPNPQPIRNPPVFCQCGHSSRKCGLFTRVSDPLGPIQLNAVGMPTPRDGCYLVRPHAVNPDLGLIKLTPGPATHRMSKARARQNCVHHTQNFVTQYCAQTFKAQMNSFLDACALDYMSWGNIDDLASVLRSFQWWCEDAVLMDYHSYKHTTSGPLTLPAQFTNGICPSMCSGLGTCTNRTCTCSRGRTGRDCSRLLSGYHPVILGIKGGDVCQVSSGHCANPILVVRNMHRGKLQAVLTVKQGSTGNTQATTYNLEPVYESKFTVSVPIFHTLSTMLEQSVANFEIRISSDGIHFSPPYQYMVYDDKCQDCNDSKKCFLKLNSCHIGGKCYLENEVNSKNSAQMCDPDVSLLHWSKNVHTTTASSSTSMTGNTRVVPIIGK